MDREIDGWIIGSWMNLWIQGMGELEFDEWMRIRWIDGNQMDG